MLLIVQSIFFILREIVASKSAEINLINDYTRKQSGRVVVTGHLCWESEEVVHLANELFTYNISYVTLKPQLLQLTTEKICSNLYVLDYSCNKSLELLKLANEKYYFKSPHHWLILLTNQTAVSTYITENIFNKFYIFMDSRVVLATKIMYTGYYLKYIYKIRKTSNLTNVHLATWKKDIGFVFYDSEILSRRRKNMHRNILRTTMVITNNDSYNHLEDYRYGNVDGATKVTYFTTFFLADFLNATLKVLFVKDYYSLSSDQNNTLIGHMINDESDISGTRLFCRSDRKNLYYCMPTASQTRWFFILRQPPLSYVEDIFILPFDLKLWLTNISALLFCAVILYTIVTWEWKIIKEDETTREYDMIDATVSDSVLFTIGAVCQQGYATEPKGFPGKILMLTVFIMLIFLFTAYTAYTMVLFQSPANINTLEDLYDSKISLGADNKTYFRKMFPTFTDPLRRKIYEEHFVTKGVQKNFYPVEVGIKKVRHETFAFHVDISSPYHHIMKTFFENEKCSLSEIPYGTDDKVFTAAPRQTNFLELLKIGCMRIQEAGLKQREYKRIVIDKITCDMQENVYRSIGMKDIKSLYKLYVIGVILSVVILILEIITHKCKVYKNAKCCRCN